MAHHQGNLGALAMLGRAIEKQGEALPRPLNTPSRRSQLLLRSPRPLTSRPVVTPLRADAADPMKEQPRARHKNSLPICPGASHPGTAASAVSIGWPKSHAKGPGRRWTVKEHAMNPAIIAAIALTAG